MSLDVSPSAEGMQNMYRQDWGEPDWPSSWKGASPLSAFSCRISAISRGRQTLLCWMRTRTLPSTWPVARYHLQWWWASLYGAGLMKDPIW